jgi:hypothetical protein
MRGFSLVQTAAARRASHGQIVAPATPKSNFLQPTCASSAFERCSSLFRVRSGSA